MGPGAGRRVRLSQHSAFFQYQEELHRYLARRLRGAHEAEDLAQEVYLRVLRVENGELIRSPLDYLYGIAAHVVYQFRIRTHRDVVTFDSELLAGIAAKTSPEPEEMADRLSLQREMARALGELPPMQRAVFLLRSRDGCSIPEIARHLDLSTHTVKKYLFQARAQVRISLQSQGRAAP